jgi:hypothetical protein
MFTDPQGLAPQGPSNSNTSSYPSGGDCVSFNGMGETMTDVATADFDEEELKAGKIQVAAGLVCTPTNLSGRIDAGNQSLSSAVADTGRAAWNAAIGAVEATANLIGGGAIPGSRDYVPFMDKLRAQYDAPAFGATVEVLTGIATAVGAGRVLGSLGQVEGGGIAPVLQGQLGGSQAAGISEGVTLFRVFGGEARGLGASWTTVNPGSVPNYRTTAGLFPGNSGQFLIQGRLTSTEGVSLRQALPGPGGVGGGLPEVLVPKPATQICIQCVSGVNPPF